MVPRRPLTLALVTALLASGCSREPAFEDRTARVTWGDRTVTFQVEACGLDGGTVYVVGRTDSGAVLQAVVGVEADGETGVPESTGITVFDFDVTDVTAFGDEAWARRGETGEAPGEVETARVKGARIQASGTGVPTGDDGRAAGGEAQALRFDARCDARDE